MSVVPVAFSLLNDAGLEVMYHFGHLRAPLVRVEGVPLLSDVPQLHNPHQIKQGYFLLRNILDASNGSIHWAC